MPEQENDPFLSEPLTQGVEQASFQVSANPQESLIQGLTRTETEATQVCAAVKLAQ
jgi:hypothetical protein